MGSTTEKAPCVCVKCKKTSCIAVCYGCQQAFCTRHFIKHRLALARQADDLHYKYERFQQDLRQNNFAHSLRSSIDAWERCALAKVQEIADRARDDLRQWMDKTRDGAEEMLKRMLTELQSNAEQENYIEADLDQWKQQLTELQASVNKPTDIDVVEDHASTSSIGQIRVVHQRDIVPEEFKVSFGPCELSENNCRATHLNYRAGLSKISGIHDYSSGRHSIRILIVKKGAKNIFLGIHSASKEHSSAKFDSSLYGWWDLDYTIVNGESIEGDSREILRAGDELTLTVDCNNRQIQLEHHRTNRLVHLPIRLDVCPFPWKLLVRLIATGDSVRILP